MFSKHYELMQLVDKNGLVSAENLKLAEQNEQLAVEIVKSMLGMTIVVRNRKFILTNLELYYGGIGDFAHDWHRKFVKKHNNIENTKAYAQLKKGPRIYLNQKGGGKHKRMDIVLGSEGVAISALVRNVADENGNLVGALTGAPNTTLKAMGINDQDHDKSLEENSGIYLVERHQKFNDPSIKIETRPRAQGSDFIGFPKYNDTKAWNFSISGLSYLFSGER